MKYEKVRNVEIIKTSTKYWVKVTFANGTMWLPGLRDLGKIISGIGKCEDIKYPNGEGHAYTKRFLESCWGKTREEIDALYYKDFDPKSTDSLNKAGNEGWGNA